MNTSSLSRLAIAITSAITLNAAVADDDRREEKSQTANRSIPSVIVTVENSAPSRGAFQTPFWVGLHSGTFDIYDRDRPLGAEGLVPAPAVERLAEDGATGPITEAFAQSDVGSPQATLVGPSGPLAPGDVVSKTFNVDPLRDRYLSYASMVIPSNDAFIANGSPVAHPLFNEQGRFIGEGFAVAGQEVLDAGTEVNDEVAANTAFINQGGPDIGLTEEGTVVLHEGFALPGTLSFPDGVLNTPALGFADFLAPNYRVANFSVRYVDLGGITRFVGVLDTASEVTSTPPDSNASGESVMVSFNANSASIRIRTRSLSSPIEMAHLHLGAAGSNGPLVVNLTNGIRGNNVFASFSGADVAGPLADSDDPMLALLNEVAAGNVYINIHTTNNPGGEIRGQLTLR